MRAGWRIHKLTWLELLNWTKHPARDSAHARALLGDDHEWNLGNQLLAGVHDRLAESNWQRSGGKGPRPRPLPRPGVGTGDKGRKFGNTAGRAPVEVRAELARMAGRAPMT